MNLKINFVVSFPCTFFVRRDVCRCMRCMRLWFACDAWRYTNLFWLI